MDPILSVIRIGSKSWVRSLITLSTPHDGTTLLEALTRIEPDGTRNPQVFFAVLAALSDYCSLPPFCYYDFDLGQWMQAFATGTQPRQIQPRDLTLKVVKDFQTNFNDSNTLTPWPSDPKSLEDFYSTTDSATYDMTLQGMTEFNSWVKESEQVYYLSYTTLATEPDSRNFDPQTNEYRHCGVPSVMRFFNLDLAGPLAEQLIIVTGVQTNQLGPDEQPTLNFTRLMGGYADRASRNRIDSSWWPNDGIVNSISMTGPTLGRTTCNIVTNSGGDLVKG